MRRGLFITLIISRVRDSHAPSGCAALRSSWRYRILQLVTNCNQLELYIKTQRPRRVYLFHQSQGTIVVFVHEDGDVVGTAGGGYDNGVFYASTKEKGGGKGEEDVF